MVQNVAPDGTNKMRRFVALLLHMIVPSPPFRTNFWLPLITASWPLAEERVCRIFLHQCQGETRAFGCFWVLGPRVLPPVLKSPNRFTEAKFYQILPPGKPGSLERKEENQRCSRPSGLLFCVVSFRDVWRSRDVPGETLWRRSGEGEDQDHRCWASNMVNYDVRAMQMLGYWYFTDIYKSEHSLECNPWISLGPVARDNGSSST